MFAAALVKGLYRSVVPCSATQNNIASGDGQLFLYLRRIIRYDAYRVSLPCAIKTKLIRTFIQDLAYEIEINFSAAVAADATAFGADEMSQLWKLTLDTVFSRLKLSGLKRGIPDKALTILFDRTRLTIDNLYSTVEKICRSPGMFQNNKEKNNAVFQSMAGFEDALVASFETAADTLNGELNKALADTKIIRSVCRGCKEVCPYKR